MPESWKCRKNVDKPVQYAWKYISVYAQYIIVICEGVEHIITSHYLVPKQNCPVELNTAAVLTRDYYFYSKISFECEMQFIPVIKFSSKTKTPGW